MIIVHDAADPRLARFRLNDRGLASRADRRDDDGAGLFLAEGDLVVERALAAGCRPVAALVDADRVPAVADKLGVDVFAGDDEVRRFVTGLGLVHSIVALFERPARPPVADLAAASHRLVILEGVDNPANVGSIVRNAAGLGWDGLVLDRASADPLARRALRVAMGTAFTVPHARTATLVDELSVLHEAGFTLVALSTSPQARPLDDVATAIGDRRRAVVIGNERAGLSDDLLRRADIEATIPMRGGVDSLNAGAASAIALYELAARP